MKHLYYSILIGCILLFTGCNDWLDVKPRSETTEKTLFSTEEGYKSALTGVYIKLGASNLYGRNTSMYVPEALARSWEIPSFNTSQGSQTSALIGNILYKIGEEYDYTYPGVESIINSIWSDYYNAVSQINNILENLEGNKITFSQNNDQLIKGEALGLRAFIHLEVLRFYGPVPLGLTGNQTDVIPYVTEMTKDPNKLISKSYSEVLELLEKDLDDAEKLLAGIDPIFHYTNNELNKQIVGGNAPKDEWHCYRQNRFNYYAVLGTKARFYHWIGNKEKAASYAKLVIEAENKNGTKKFPLSNRTNSYGVDGNLVMFCEHLFGLHNADLQNIVQPLFVNEKPIFRQSRLIIEEAYEIGIHRSDVRAQEGVYWEFDETITNWENHFLKYSKSNNAKAKNVIPLLRLAEMYFIAIENLPIGEETTSLFSEFGEARSLDATIFNSLTDEAAVISRMEKEYRKDFFGEGQMFFFYKRHNYRTYRWPLSFEIPQGAYVLPKPKGQLSFE